MSSTKQKTAAAKQGATTKQKTAAKQGAPDPNANRAEPVGPHSPVIPREFTIGAHLGGPPEPRAACVAAAVITLNVQAGNNNLVGVAAHSIRHGRSAADAAPPKVDTLADALRLHASDRRYRAHQALADAIRKAGNPSMEVVNRHDLDTAAALLADAARADELALWLARVKVFDAVFAREDGAEGATARALAAAGFRLPE